MYANVSPTSAAPAPLSPLPPGQPPQVQPGTQQHAPQHAPLPPGSYGGPPGNAAAMVPLQPAAVHAAPVRSNAPAFVTGAYQSSGDPAIDRMLRLEAACKRFGSPF